jgi:RNA polymerase sigma-70 factor, ECF subfamily
VEGELGCVNHIGSSEFRRAQDREFVELLARHKTQLFRLIFCMVHRLPDAEDVFQQASITMWDKFSEFEPGTSFFHWAASIARFKALGFLQASSRRRQWFSDEMIDELLQLEERSSLSLQESRLAALAACREKLKQTDQALLTACYGDGRPIVEVAAGMGRPVGSVYDSLSRIRRALFHCIQRTLSVEGAR